jgi:hypothetical protein
MRMMAMFGGLAAIAVLLGAAPQETQDELPRLTLKLSRARALAFEPVYATARLENRNAYPIRFTRAGFNLEGETDLELLQGAAWSPVTIGGRNVLSIEGTETLAPGAFRAVGSRVDLGGVPSATLPDGFTGRRKLRLAQEFRAGEDAPKLRVLSDELELEIVAPTAEVDRAALALLADPEAGAVYQLSGGADEEAIERGVRKLEDLVSLHRTSAYAPAAAFAAGEHHFSLRWVSTLRGAERLPDGSPITKVRDQLDHRALKKAVELYGAVIERATDPALLLRARLRLARRALDVQRGPDAAAHLDAADALDVDALFKDERAGLRELVQAGR